MRFFLEISFKGTNYKGWQIQPKAKTIQAEINKVLTKLLLADTKCVGCGRTDTSVHASQFYLHFDSPAQPHNKLPALFHNSFHTSSPSEKNKDEAIINANYERDFLYKLNRLLPDDIAVKRIIPVDDTARSRQDATARTYEYRLHFRKDPFLNEFSYYHPYGVPDLKTMNEAARLMPSFKDFRPLSKKEEHDKTTICNITRSRWQKPDSNRMSYTITADHFLRGMVRMTVGVMLMLGTGKMSISEFRHVMKTKGRFKYVPSVPGCGLTLVAVDYPYIK